MGLKKLYDKYKDYIRVDLIMYVVMLLGVFVYVAVILLFN